MCAFIDGFRSVNRSRRLSSVVHSCAAAVKCCIVSCCIACCMFGACCIVYRVRGHCCTLHCMLRGLRAEAALQRPHGRGPWAVAAAAGHGPAWPGTARHGTAWAGVCTDASAAVHGMAPHRTAPHRIGECTSWRLRWCALSVGRTRTSRAMPASRRCTTLCVHCRPLVLSSPASAYSSSAVTIVPVGCLPLAESLGSPRRSSAIDCHRTARRTARTRRTAFGR